MTQEEKLNLLDKIFMTLDVRLSDNAEEAMTHIENSVKTCKSLETALQDGFNLLYATNNCTWRFVKEMIYQSFIEDDSDDEDDSNDDVEDSE